METLRYIPAYILGYSEDFETHVGNALMGGKLPGLHDLSLPQLS